MALSLFGERSVTAAATLNPLVSFTRWMNINRAARKRRNTLSALLELDDPRLNDLGISRDDIVAAMQAQGRTIGSSLNAARSRNARL